MISISLWHLHCNPLIRQWGATHPRCVARHAAKALCLFAPVACHDDDDDGPCPACLNVVQGSWALRSACNVATLTWGGWGAIDRYRPSTLHCGGPSAVVHAALHVCRHADICYAVEARQLSFLAHGMLCLTCRPKPLLGRHAGPAMGMMQDRSFPTYFFLIPKRLLGHRTEHVMTGRRTPAFFAVVVPAQVHQWLIIMHEHHACSSHEPAASAPWPVIRTSSTRSSVRCPLCVPV